MIGQNEKARTTMKIVDTTNETSGAPVSRPTESVRSLHGVLAVIPTLSAARLPNVRSLILALRMKGAEVLVVANGLSVYNQLCADGLPVITEGSNLGFGAAVNLAAATSGGHKWLLLVNDDIELSDLSIFDGLEAISTAGENSLVTFGDEPALTVPAAWDVYSSLSLFAGFHRGASSQRKATALPSGGRTRYFPFSLVAISWPLWKKLGGLDERFPFTYEDADFTRRAIAAGAAQIQLTGVGVRHGRSLTGRAQVGQVLPVGAWGAYQYLQKWTFGKRRAAAVCIVALLSRVLLLPASRARLSDHFRGTMNAINAIARNEAPKLPEYSDF